MGNQPSPLRQAIRWSDTEKVQKIVDRAGQGAAKLINDDHSPDCILQSCTRVDGNAFYYAISKNRLKIIRILLSKGGDPYATGPVGETCLHCTARNNYIEAARILIECGIDPKTTDDHGRYPIHSACMSFFDTSRFIKFLLEEVGDRNDVNVRDFRQRTPLHEAAWFGNSDVARTLLENGADVNALDKDGNTPLHFANRRPPIWNMLLTSGADLTVKNNKNQTPEQSVH